MLPVRIMLRMRLKFFISLLLFVIDLEHI